MPIDDALEKIEKGEEKGKKKPDAESLSENNLSLFEEARIELGEYLTKVYFVNEIKMYPSINFFMSQIAPFLLLITPVKQESADSPQKINFINELDSETWSNCMKPLQYLLDIKILKPDESGLIKIEPKKFFPEYSVMTSIIFADKHPEDSNPFQIVMGMEPKYRPLMAVVIVKATECGTIAVQKNNRKSLDNMKQNLDDMKQKILGSLPSLNDISRAALEYKIINFQKTLEDFNQVTEMYRTLWW